MSEKRRKVVLVMVILLLLLLAACGSGGQPQPTAVTIVDPVGTSVQQTVEAIAVAQTVAALTGTETTVTAQPTPDLNLTVDASPLPPDQPTPTAAEPQPTVSDTPPTTAATCVVVSGVNLRSGPGTAYDPPLSSVRPDTQLVPLAFSPVGYPLGQWLLVQVPGTGAVGWVSFGPQWVTCNFDPATLPPPGTIPPTPVPIIPPTAVPSPTATATRTLLPPVVDNDAPGGSFPTDHVFGQVIVDPTFLFRMDVRDLNVGDFEGAGIISAEFFISGEGVDYSRLEQTAGFCVFGGGEPTCRPWPTNEFGQFTWGEGGPVVQTGNYRVNINVTAANFDPDFGDSWNWNFDFRVRVP